MTSFINKLRAARFRQAGGGDGDLVADVLLPPPLPLIKLPDEPQPARTGAMEGRPMHLPVRRHLHLEQRNQPPEPNLLENRLILAAQADEENAKPVVRRVRVYEYNQPEVFQNCGAPDDTLVFDSLFEGGNLQRAERVFRESPEPKKHTSSSASLTSTPHEYELVIHPDIKNSAYRQWFYFEVRNAQPGTVYKFSLVNLAKSGALFGYGLQPCVYSEIDAETKQRGWVHSGTSVRYDVSMSPNAPPGTNALSFQYVFEHANDRVYFACLQPYSYTDLVEYLDKLERDPLRNAFVRRSELCQTIAQNACELLSITSSTKESVPPDEKRLIVLSARVHPGEPNSSWMMKGMIDYLTGPSSGAAVLRNNFVFKIVPMLNPDGVINGNTRVNLAGWDLNRKWSSPVEKLFPTVFHLKKLLTNWQSRDRVAIYCDLHGHSINRNIFTYGCYTKRSNKKQNAAVNAAVLAATASAASGAEPSRSSSYDSGYPYSRSSLTCGGGQPQISVKNDPRVFPMIVAKNSEFFSFQNCDFKVHKSKLNTARVVVNHELGVINSYTLEASFCGPDFGPRKDTQFSLWDLEDMGRAWCQSLLIYFGLLPQVRELDRKRDSERHQQHDPANADACSPAKSPALGLSELTALTPDAALLELNGDILSDCEAAISELFATVDLLDERTDGGLVLALSDSGDSDISGAEDAIPPNNEPEDDALRIPRDRQLQPQYVVLSADKGLVNGYCSAPEEYLRSGTQPTAKKVKRRSSIRRKKKSSSGAASGSEAGRKKSKRKSKRGRRHEPTEGGGGEEEEEENEENGQDREDGEEQTPAVAEIEEEGRGDMNSGGGGGGGGGEEDETRKPVKRKSSKAQRRHHRSHKDRSRSFRRKGSKSSNSLLADAGLEVPVRTDSGRLLPDVPGSGAGRRQKTPPMPSATEPLTAEVPATTPASSTTHRKRSGKLVRISSGQPLELPPVVLSHPTPSSVPRDLLHAMTPQKPNRPSTDSNHNEDNHSESSDDQDDDEERDESSGSSDDSGPDSVASAF